MSVELYFNRMLRFTARFILCVSKTVHVLGNATDQKFSSVSFGAVSSSSYSPPSGGGTPYTGLYREAPPERGAVFKLAVYKRVGKIAISLYERVTKSAAKWKKWWLKRSISKGATFWQK